MLRPTPYVNENEDIQPGVMISRLAVLNLFKAIGSAPLSYFRLGERDMQAEIYHRCRNTFTHQNIFREVGGNPIDQNQILITIESSKAAGPAGRNFGVHLEGTIHPDLMFHDPLSMNDQWCAVEFKRMSNNTDENAIKADLAAVNDYVAGPLRFLRSIFILNNVPIHPSLQAGVGRTYQANTIRDWFCEEARNEGPNGRSRYVELWVIEEGRQFEVNGIINDLDSLIIRRIFFQGQNNGGRNSFEIQTYSRSRSRLRLLQ